MAVTGAVAADVLAESRRSGLSYESAATALNFTIPTKTVTPTGGSGQISVAHTNWLGPISIDFGDGAPPTVYSGPTVSTPKVKTGMAPGSYRVRITGVGYSKQAASNVTVT